MIKRALIVGAVAVLSAAGVNQAQAENGTIPVVAHQRGVITAVVKRTHNVGWPHRWSRPELKGVTSEALRNVEANVGGAWRYNRGECWPTTRAVGRGATCFGTIILNDGDKVAWSFRFTRIYEDGSYR